jgi:hypothetical protein
MRRVLVTGSRDWPNRDAVTFTLLNERARGDFILVHGDCPTGADRFAREHAKAYGIATEVYPADWARFGRAAGPKRNQEMVDSGIDVCHAFPLGVSRGTRDCMRRVEHAGVPLIVHEGAEDDATTVRVR